MAGHEQQSVVTGFIAEVLELDAKAAPRQPAAPGTVAKEIKSLVQRDYAGPLRKSLSRCEVDEILAEAKRKVWPELNCRPGRLASVDEFAKEWSKLGIEVKAAKWSWPEGLALLGFYVNKTKGVTERPLIFVNAAHHPALMGAAFDHEMGHHLTAQLSGSRKEPARLLLDAGFADHLEDAMELAADMLVSFAIYPQGTARKIFDDPRQGGRTQRVGQELSHSEFAKVLKHVARYSLSFDGKLSAKKLQYLTALIHYTKLRRALLEEYAI